MSHIGSGTHVTGPVGNRGGTTDGNRGDGPYRGPTATPFLVTPSAAGDIGGRPIPVGQAVTSPSIVPTVAAGSGFSNMIIQLSCAVSNLGVMDCVAGVAEFYVGDQFSIWNAGHETVTPAQVKANARRVGYASFQIPAGKTVTVVCKNLWTPGGVGALQRGVLVQVYDLFTDHMTSPFDAVNDRHVARNDQVMNPIIFQWG